MVVGSEELSSRSLCFATLTILRLFLTPVNFCDETLMTPAFTQGGA